MERGIGRGLTLEGICICFGHETIGRRRFDRVFVLVAAGSFERDS